MDWREVAERAIKTWAQTFLAYLTLSYGSDYIKITEALPTSFKLAAVYASVAAVLSILSSIASYQVGGDVSLYKGYVYWRDDPWRGHKIPPER